MRKTWCLIATLLLTACAEDSDIAQVASLAYNRLFAPPQKIARERAAAVPYASIGIQLGSTDQVLFALGERIEDELHWFAGEQTYLATRRGRVVRTVGFPSDLGGVRATSDTSASPPTMAAQYQLLFDFPDLSVFGATAQCSSQAPIDEDVEILGARIAVRHIVEHCVVPVLRWNFDNDFWEDRSTGYVWRSRQYIHPKSPPVILEVLRPEQQPA